MTHLRLVIAAACACVVSAQQAASAPAQVRLRAAPMQKVRLLPSLFKDRHDLSRRYVMSLSNDNLLRWTGDVSYADYIERNLYNGVLAQQNPENGMVAYFLPLQAGARKEWGTPTNDFWCCPRISVFAPKRADAFGNWTSPRRQARATVL